MCHGHFQNDFIDLGNAFHWFLGFFCGCLFTAFTSALIFLVFYHK